MSYLDRVDGWIMFDFVRKQAISELVLHTCHRGEGKSQVEVERMFSEGHNCQFVFPF